MGIIEFVLVALAVVIASQLNRVWFNYRVVGQLIDILGIKAVQDRLFTDAHMENLNRTTQQYVFLTRYVPMLIVGVYLVMALMYMSVASGVGLSPTMSTIGSLIIAGVVAWLWNFEAAPEWLYDWHITVLLTRSLIDLEAVTESIEMFEQRDENGDYDTLTPAERDFIQLQVELLHNVHNDISQMVEQLLQQREEYRSGEE